MALDFIDQIKCRLYNQGLEYEIPIKPNQLTWYCGVKGKWLSCYCSEHFMSS